MPLVLQQPPSCDPLCPFRTLNDLLHGGRKNAALDNVLSLGLDDSRSDGVLSLKLESVLPFSTSIEGHILAEVVIQFLSFPN